MNHPKCMRFALIFMLAITCFFLSAVTSFAQSGEKILAYHDLEILAKTAMIEETDRINQELTKGNSKIAGYDEKPVKFVEQRMRKHRFKQRYLFDKCIFSENNVKAILGDEISEENDLIASKIDIFSAIKRNFNKPYGQLVLQMCEHAELRFKKRLENDVTSKGVKLDLNMNPQAILAMSKMTFFPTEFAEPSFKKKINTILNTTFSMGLIVGSGAAIAGWGFAPVLISLAVISSGSWGLRNLAPTAPNSLRHLDMSHVAAASLFPLDIDANEIEHIKYVATLPTFSQ